MLYKSNIKYKIIKLNEKKYLLFMDYKVDLYQSCNHKNRTIFQFNEWKNLNNCCEILLCPCKNKLYILNSVNAK